MAGGGINQGWADSIRWTPGALLNRVVGTEANVATSSGRYSEGQLSVSLFSAPPPCPPPLLVEMAGSTYVAPAKVIRKAVDTHSPSRLLRLLDQSAARLKSARGVKCTADGFAHLEADLPTIVEAPGPSPRRRGSRQAGSSTRGLRCPGAPVVCETTQAPNRKPVTKA